MKKRTLLFSIAGIAIVVLLVGFISYTTGTTTPQKDAEKTQTKTVTPTDVKDTPNVKEKSCSCCTERKARVKELIRRARESRQRENNIEVKASINKGNGK